MLRVGIAVIGLLPMLAVAGPPTSTRVQVTGVRSAGVAAEHVARVARRYRVAYLACFDSAKERPGLPHTADLSFELDNKARVSSVKVRSHAALRGCLEQQVRRFRLRPAEGRAKVGFSIVYSQP